VIVGASNRRNWFYLENSNPGETDVVEGDGSLEGVVADGAARRVELVPVDAVVTRRRVEGGRVARQPADRVGVGGQLRALGHAVVERLTADEVASAAVVVRRQIQPAGSVASFSLCRCKSANLKVS